MQIFAPTAVFDVKVFDNLGKRYYPGNELAEQLCWFARKPCLDENHIAGIRAMKFNVVIRNASIGSAADLSTIRAMTIAKLAYGRKSSEPRHVRDCV